MLFLVFDINLISNVHPSLPWQFKSNHSEIKIKPGEVKVVEYEVKNMMGYMKALSKFEKGNTTTVSVNREGDIMTKKITF